MNSFEEINIGLISESIYPANQIIFKKAIEDANTKNEDFSFAAVIEEITYGNPLDVSKQLCKIMETSVAAIFGPTSPACAEQAISISDAKEMPFIDIRWDFDTQLPIINLHPHPSQLAIILKDLTIAYEWGGFTILYESGDYLPLVNEILEIYGPTGPTITVRKFDLNLNGNYRQILRRVKKSNEYFLIVLSSTASLPEFFKQALQVGLLTDVYQYIIGDLDFQTINLEPYQHGEANISSIRLFSPENVKVQELIEHLKEQNLPDIITENITCPINVNLALIYDGVQLLAEVSKHIKPSPIELNCADCNSWSTGYTLVNYLKSIYMDGISGEISFDHQGLRTSFEVELIELTTAGIVKIGHWNTGDGIVIDRKVIKTNIEESKSLAKQNFIVLIALSDPYIMFKETAESLTGNAQFEGFGIQLIDELANKLGFKYSFKLQEDGKYGSKSANGEWDGMISELLKGNGDLAITDLTMTSDRESAVDFTIPFMNLGIAILFRKPKKDAPELFSFMSPFSQEVWIYLGVAYLSVACSLFVMGRLSPGEWDNPYPCIEEPTELENQFSFPNSLWFTVGALLQQGSEIAPKASSTRTLASIWWFFILILVSSYTANLAAFLTIESLSTPLQNAEDLAAGKGDVGYGAKKGGSTFQFFVDSQYPTYQKMYEYMKSHPENLPTSNPQGVNWVENNNYAFLMESTSIEYTIERKCTLTQVGSLLDEKGYGIAMRKNWPFRDVLSKGILELQEQGVLTKMKTKWWQEKRGGGACAVSGGDGGGAVALTMENLGGVFVVLITGCCCAVVISIFEMLIEVKQRASELKVSFKDELLDELKFVIKCRGNTKVLKKPVSSPNTSRNSSISSMQISNNEDFNFKSEDDVKLNKQFYSKN